MTYPKKSLVSVPTSPSTYQQEGDDGFLISNEVSVVDGAVSKSGRSYIKFEQSGRHEWIDRDFFCPSATPGILEMKQRGIKIFRKRDQNAISEHVAERTRFRDLDIIERIGWSGLRFGLPDGEIISTCNDSLPIAYRTGAVNVSREGSAEEFRKLVGRFVKDQHIMLFCMMVSLAAPLLSLSRIQGNFMFMLSGPARKGKTTGLDLAAALYGPALDGPHGRYYLKFNNTMNRIEELMPFYNDMALIIDELGSQGTRAGRSAQFSPLVHHLTGVHGRGRFGDEVKPADQTRTIGLISSNDRAADLLGFESQDAAEGVMDRLFEIPVPRGIEGCFNAPHPTFLDRRDYAEEIRARVGRVYGAPIRTYLAETAKLRERDDAAFKDRLNERIAGFARRPEVQALGRVSSRALDAFGLVCAAGHLGRLTGVLPKSCDPFAATLHCLRLHLGARVELDPVQRLLGWVGANKVIDLRGRQLPAMSKGRLNRKGAFIGECRGIPQLWIAPTLFKSAFTDGNRLLRELETLHVLKVEGQGKDRHLAIKSAVRRAAKPDRMYAFMISDFEEWLDENGYPRHGRKRR